MSSDAPFRVEAAEGDVVLLSRVFGAVFGGISSFFRAVQLHEG